MLTVTECSRGGGRKLKVIELTDRGYQKLGIDPVSIPERHGGTEHRMTIRDIRLLLEEDGWGVHVEHNGTDIVAEKDERVIAFEVETCKQFNSAKLCAT